MSLVSSAPAFVARNSRSVAYEIEQSLRFESGDTHYLNRTPGSAGNRKTWTFSCWFKRPKVTQSIFFISGGFSGGGATQSDFRIRLRSDSDSIEVANAVSNSNTFTVHGSPRFRDPSAWYHLVVAMDTTQSTASDRVKIWVNGEQITAFATSDYPSLNEEPLLNTALVHRIGAWDDNGSVYSPTSPYLAEMYHVDGTALDHEDFGEYDTNGVWRPIRPTISSYGTTGFYLNFSNSSDLGEDQAGSNDWTANNFTTSGTGTDVMSDTPTKNFNTLNSAIRPYTATPAEVLSDGNLKLTCSSSSVSGSSWSTMLITSGKWYWEGTLSTAGASNNTIGWCNSTEDAGRGTNVADLRTNGVCYVNDGDKVINVTKTSYGDSFTAGDVIGAQLDADAGTITFYKNGVSQGDITGQSPQSDSAGWLAAVEGFNGTVWDVNFGQREFAYPPGTASATSHFNVITYTGNGSTQSLTGVGFQPDFVWIKRYNGSGHHVLTDVVRGTTKQLWSNRQESEQTSSLFLTSFDSDGFSVGDSSVGYGNVNTSGDSFVAWCWKAGGTASSNTDGSITSSVSANQTGGFSIVTYSGSTQNDTVGHGLDTAPSMIIFKRRNNTTSWPVYHPAIGPSNLVQLNETAGSTSSGNSFGSTPTAPTSTVFSVGDNGATNYGDMVAYCFAEKSGLSKIGSYTGNGSNTGPFVECGFKPRFVMLKRTDSTSDWFMYDTIRGTNNKLYAETNTGQNAEDGGSTSSNTILSLSSGFQLTSGNGSNQSGGTYIFMAFAENFSADTTYKALNTSNLPAPTIEDGSDYFTTLAYSGTSTTDSKVIEDSKGNDWAPDFVWLKKRNSGANHMLYDRVRGASKSLRTNTTGTEVTGATNGDLTAFTSNGFTLNSGNDVNASGNTYVAWNWLAGNGTSSNTNGSITSTVSANTTAGFSIVGYTGDGTQFATIGHGLGVAPKMVIVKNRDSTNGWAILHTEVGTTGTTLDGAPEYYMMTFTTNGRQNFGSDSVWDPTSTTFKVAATTNANWVNGNGSNYIAYCFAEVEGYSKFGSYTGNGSSDGPFVYCGFKPAFVMIKRTDTSNDWVMKDAARSSYNAAVLDLYANTSQAEVTFNPIDFTSNGFKLRNSNASPNASGGTYIFACFASSPFGGSGVTPATAR